MKLALSLIMSLVCLGQFAQAGQLVAGTKHDFSGAGYIGSDGLAFKYTYGGTCGACHSAHTPKKAAQLWKRVLSAGDWTVWNGSDAGVVLGAGDADFLSDTQFRATGSAMCLSCHDGVTALSGSTYMIPNVWTGTQHTGKVVHTGMLGNQVARNLAMMHPVAKKVPFGTEGWRNTLAEGNTFAASNVAADSVGASQYVGCTSCHSMHKSGASKLLRDGDRCLSCHAK